MITNRKGEIMLKKAEDIGQFWAYDSTFSKNSEMRGQVFGPAGDNVPEATTWKTFRGLVVRIKDALIMANTMLGRLAEFIAFRRTGSFTKQLPISQCTRTISAGPSGRLQSRQPMADGCHVLRQWSPV